MWVLRVLKPTGSLNQQVDNTLINQADMTRILINPIGHWKKTIVKLKPLKFTIKLSLSPALKNTS